MYKRQGYVWLTIGVNPVYVDTVIRIESAADLCGRCLDDVATDVLYMTGNEDVYKRQAFLIALSHLPGAAELAAKLPKSGGKP